MGGVEPTSGGKPFDGLIGNENDGGRAPEG